MRDWVIHSVLMQGCQCYKVPSGAEGLAVDQTAPAEQQCLARSDQIRLAAGIQAMIYLRTDSTQINYALSGGVTTAACNG